MNQFLQTLFFFLLVTQICFAQFEFSDSYIQTKISEGQIKNSFQSKINSSILDSIITGYITSENIPGAAGLIFDEDGDILWSGNFGYKNLQYQLPVEDSTYFLMASISKTFIATAIMQLWEKGIINLDASINDYLPAGFIVKNPYNPNKNITVRMLMLHTSSLRDNWGILFNLWACGDYPLSVDSFLVKYFTPGGTYYSLNNFSNTHPGNYWEYSNAGVCLLALVIKNLTGKKFDEYARDSILTPLSMNSSSWFLEGMDTSKITTPYRGNNTPYAMCHIGFAYWPVIQLRTNKLELANFASAYLHNGIYKNYKLLDSTTIALMLSDYVYISWGSQGLIWGAAPTLIHDKVWGHDGAFAGTQTGMFICREENWGIIFFVNRGEPPNFSSGFFSVLKQMANYAHLITTDVKSTEQLPTEFVLSQNFPNPFNPSTRIQYQVSSNSHVSLKVYDVLGNEVASLVNEEKEAGRYEVEFDAEKLSSGVYFYQLKAGNFIATRKMLLLK